jgi:hypothetical protein
MTIVFCDHCNTPIESNGSVLRTSQDRLRGLLSGGSLDKPRETIDLCYRCASEFSRWLNNVVPEPDPDPAPEPAEAAGVDFTTTTRRATRQKEMPT